MDALAEVFRYHDETKHHFFRYARSLGYMDWANQPDPFRRFEGAPIIPLPLLKAAEAPLPPPYADLFEQEKGLVVGQPVTIRSLSRFLEYALSITAWKQAGEVRWALRSNPSSGNLHPTEGYVLIGAMPGLGRAPGLYHYLSKDHALERRAKGDVERYAQLLRPFPAGSFLFGFSSIHWREAWKYGERAFRYCQHDLGHAIGSARMAAAALGWRLTSLHGLSDAQVASLLGLDREDDFGQAEREHPGCLCLVWPRLEVESGRSKSLPLWLEWPDQPVLTDWHGRANRLSSDHPVDWEIIDSVAQAAWKASSETTALEESNGSGLGLPESRPPAGYPRRPSAGEVIHQRRSALAFDGKTGLAASSFFLMLARVMPRAHRPVLNRPVPWDALPWSPAIHLAFFVHRVEGMLPGLYVLLRDPAKQEALRRAMLDSFEWAKPTGCPEDLPLFRLQEGDARKVATQVSCGQDIAGDGAFSLGMIAEFAASLRRHGPWFYRRLFWETGVIGQVLYLEAEAAGIRSTGIGCYFDDPVHQVLGLKDSAFQSLYHFTVGGPVEDPRLTTLPPYAIPV